MDITELNELIYAWAKIVSDKISIFLRNLNSNTKPGREMRVEGQMKKLR